MPSAKKEPIRGIRRFILMRVEDVHGTSGEGVVAEGAEYSNGKCVIAWLSCYGSLEICDNIATVQSIHGHGGATVIVWEDEKPLPHT